MIPAGGEAFHLAEGADGGRRGTEAELRPLLAELAHPAVSTGSSPGSTSPAGSLPQQSRRGGAGSAGARRAAGTAAQQAHGADSAGRPRAAHRGALEVGGDDHRVERLARRDVVAERRALAWSCCRDSGSRSRGGGGVHEAAPGLQARLGSSVTSRATVTSMAGGAGKGDEASPRGSFTRDGFGSGEWVVSANADLEAAARGPMPYSPCHEPHVPDGVVRPPSLARGASTSSSVWARAGWARCSRAQPRGSAPGRHQDGRRGRRHRGAARRRLPARGVGLRAPSPPVHRAGPGAARGAGVRRARVRVRAGRGARARRPPLSGARDPAPRPGRVAHRRARAHRARLRARLRRRPGAEDAASCTATSSPSNVLLDWSRRREDRADFGIAKVLGVFSGDAPRARGRARSAVAWRPSRPSGEAVDERADVYAAGLLALGWPRDGAGLPLRQALVKDEQEPLTGRCATRGFTPPWRQQGGPICREALVQISRAGASSSRRRSKLTLRRREECQRRLVRAHVDVRSRLARARRPARAMEGRPREDGEAGRCRARDAALVHGGAGRRTHCVTRRSPSRSTTTPPPTVSPPSDVRYCPTERGRASSGSSAGGKRPAIGGRGAPVARGPAGGAVRSDPRRRRARGFCTRLLLVLGFAVAVAARCAARLSHLRLIDARGAWSPAWIC